MVVSYLMPAFPDEPDLGHFEYALRLLMSGVQDYEAFRLVAEHVIDRSDAPGSIDPMVIKWLAKSFTNILVDKKSANLALGLKRKVGRSTDTILITKVQAYVELCMREKMRKTKALLKAANKFSKEPRQIERILDESKVKLDFSIWSNESLKAFVEHGFDVRPLGDVSFD